MAKDIGTETIRVKRVGKVDKLDDSSEAPVEHDVDGCAIIPGATYEEGRGWVLTDSLDVYAPYDADVEPDDTVIARGETWRVEGAVGRFVTRKGKQKAARIRLERRGLS